MVGIGSPLVLGDALLDRIPGESGLGLRIRIDIAALDATLLLSPLEGETALGTSSSLKLSPPLAAPLGILRSFLETLLMIPEALLLLLLLWLLLGQMLPKLPPVALRGMPLLLSCCICGGTGMSVANTLTSASTRERLRPLRL